MTFDIDDHLQDYLQVKGISHLTLDLEDIPSSCCLGRLPELKITYQPPPDNPQDYRYFDVNGLHLYLSWKLRTEEKLRLFLSGFGPFKNIEVSGINLIL